MNQSLENKLSELSDAIAIQAEVLSLVVMQLAEVKASIETALATEREILSRQGMDKEEIKQRQQSAYSASLLIATNLLQPHLERIGRSSKGPPDVDPAKN